jgi:ABC-2 type transport system permease protein
LPLVFAGMIAFSIIVAERQTDRTVKIAVLDSVGGLVDQITKSLDEKLPNGTPAVTIVRSYDGSFDVDQVRQTLVGQVRQGTLDGYLVLPGGLLKGEAAEFHTNNSGDIHLTAAIRRALSEAVIARRLTDQGVKVTNLRDFVRGINLTLVDITQRGETEERGQTLVVVTTMALGLYLTLLLYGVATMRSVLEEKMSRVVELLLASVKPFQLLVGKILGVAGVALTQYLIWTASASLLGGYAHSVASMFQPGSKFPAIHMPIAVLAYLFIFFLVGYLLYASLFAATGATVSNEQDLQQAQIPVTALIATGFILFNVVMRNSNSGVSIALSLVPLFAPILMPLRIAIAMPPFWQIASSLLLLGLTAVGVVYVAARIYRVGILMYGKRASLVELLRWVRYS